MKFAVINFSGNVGKTTTARHLLAPRLKNPELFSVESINADDNKQTLVLRGAEFGDLQETLVVMDNVVVDIGASNVEDFMGLMEDFSGSHEDFDFFIVPTVPELKQQQDTISTIAALADLGVPPAKIRVVFNMVAKNAEPAKVFAGLFEYYNREKCFTLNANAVIHSNEIYRRINGTDKTISGILNDDTDYETLLKQAKTTDEKVRIAKQRSVRRLADGVNNELDAVFKLITT